jgi:hypothetical protein
MEVTSLSTPFNATTTKETVTRCLYSWHELSLDLTYDKINFVLFIPLAIFVGIVGLFGNTLAYVVIGLERPFTSTSVFLRALALSDNAVLVFFIWVRTFISIAEYIGNFSIYFEFHNLSLSYLWTLRWFTKTISVYVTLCVATERYIAVCKPLKAASICTLRNARIAVTLAVLLSFACQFPTIFNFKLQYYFDPCTGRELPVWTYDQNVVNDFGYMIIYTYVFSMVLLSIFPTFILTFFACSLLSTLRKASRSALSAEVKTRTDSMRPVTVRVIAVVVVFIILETPGNLMQLVSLLTDYDVFEIHWMVFNSFLHTTYFLGVVNSVVNFYVYCLTGRRFRKSFLRVLSLSTWKRSDTGSTSRSYSTNR